MILEQKDLNFILSVKELESSSPRNRAALTVKPAAPDNNTAGREKESREKKGEQAAATPSKEKHSTVRVK